MKFKFRRTFVSLIAVIPLSRNFRLSLPSKLWEIIPYFIEFSPLAARTFRFFDLKAADDDFPRGIIVRTGKPVQGGRCDQLLVLRQNVHAVVRARQQQQNAEQSHSKVDPLPRHLQNFIVFAIVCACVYVCVC